MRTQVAIIGAGPAGLVLAHLLRLNGVAATVLERHDRAYVEGRVRAGVLEQITMDVMARLKLDGRLRRQGLMHDGTNLVSNGEMFRIEMAAHTGGRRVAVYGQQEVMHDLFEAAVQQKPVCHLAKRRPGRAAGLRFHRGLRRFSRGQPRSYSRQRAEDF